MQSSYSIAIQVSFEHGYFARSSAKGPFGQFTVEPTIAGQRALKQLGALARQQGATLTVLKRGAGPFPPADATASDIEFAWQPIDADFINYTDLPNVSLRSQIFVLSEGPMAGELQSEFLPLYGLAFDLPFAQPANGLLVVSETSGEQVFSATLNDSNSTPVDLRLAGPGIFNASLDGTPISKFYASDELSQRGAFGALSLPARLVSDSSSKLVASFEARKTKWRYNVFNWEKGTKEASIVSKGDESIKFLPPDDRPFHNGQAALSFESVDGIPLRARPTYQFQLQDQNNNTVVPRLPYPDNSLSGATDNGRGSTGDLFSDVFFHYNS